MSDTADRLDAARKRVEERGDDHGVSAGAKTIDDTGLNGEDAEVWAGELMASWFNHCRARDSRGRLSYKAALKIATELIAIGIEIEREIERERIPKDPVFGFPSSGPPAA